MVLSQSWDVEVILEGQSEVFFLNKQNKIKDQTRYMQGMRAGLFFHKVPNMSRDMFIKKNHFQWTGS
jgi:hypothetical protein